MTLPLVVIVGWIGAAAVMLAVWLVQRRTRNAGIVDVAWSFATGGLGAAFALAGSHLIVQLLKRTVTRARPRMP